MKLHPIFLFLFTVQAQKVATIGNLPSGVDVIELDNSVLMTVMLRPGPYSVRYSTTHLLILFKNEIFVRYKLPQFIKAEEMQSVTLDEKELCIVLPKRKVDDNGMPIHVDYMEEVKTLIDIRQNRLRRPELQLMASPY